MSNPSLSIQAVKVRVQAFKSDQNTERACMLAYLQGYEDATTRAAAITAQTVSEMKKILDPVLRPGNSQPHT